MCLSCYDNIGALAVGSIDSGTGSDSHSIGGASPAQLERKQLLRTMSQPSGNLLPGYHRDRDLRSRSASGDFGAAVVDRDRVGIFPDDIDEGIAMARNRSSSLASNTNNPMLSPGPPLSVGSPQLSRPSGSPFMSPMQGPFSMGAGLELDLLDNATYHHPPGEAGDDDKDDDDDMPFAWAQSDAYPTSTLFIGPAPSTARTAADADGELPPGSQSTSGRERSSSKSGLADYLAAPPPLVGFPDAPWPASNAQVCPLNFFGLHI